jgi:5-hydroxyisourate hydrolase-like protein (transthyretin family)
MVVVVSAALTLAMTPSAIAATPDPVTHLKATPANHQVGLSWTLPGTPFDSILVRRAQGTTPPAGTSDGTQVYNGTGTQVTDTGLSNGVTYSYSVWAMSGGSPSDVRQVSAEPHPATAVSLQLKTDSHHVSFGNTATLTATVTSTKASKPVSGETVQLQVRTGSADSWHQVTDGVSNSKGRVAWQVAPQRTNQYRAVHVATPFFGGAQTKALTVVLKPALQAALGKDWARQAGTAVVHGRVRPAFRGERVLLERRVNGHWRKAGSSHQDAQGRYRFRLSGWPKRGAYVYRTAIASNASHRAVHSSALHLAVDWVVTYRIETRGKIVASLSGFAKRAAGIYADPRGWSRAFVHFERVKGASDFSLVLSQAKDVPKFAPICDRYWSCRVGRYVIINESRWRFGTPYFKKSGGNMRMYHEMVINHETGHWFGLGHQTCPGPGRKAPVMMQQSKGLFGCKPNGWPLPVEIKRVY